MKTEKDWIYMGNHMDYGEKRYVMEQKSIWSFSDILLTSPQLTEKL